MPTYRFGKRYGFPINAPEETQKFTDWVNGANIKLSKHVLEERKERISNLNMTEFVNSLSNHSFVFQSEYLFEYVYDYNTITGVGNVTKGCYRMQNGSSIVIGKLDNSTAILITVMLPNKGKQYVDKSNTEFDRPDELNRFLKQKKSSIKIIARRLGILLGLDFY